MALLAQVQRCNAKGQMQAGNAAAEKLDGVGHLSVCQTKYALKFVCLLFRFNDTCA